MVKFDTMEDKCKVISGGLWTLLNHYLFKETTKFVSTWSPNFIVETAKIESTLVWICFPSLNMLFYDEKCVVHYGIHGRETDKS